MAEPILVLRLEGPMQSWGTRSRWDVRDTGLEPTKSGVIGLIGCAMGLSRGDPELERLDRSLLFGVRIDRPGLVTTDFHTVTGYHRTAAGAFKHSGGTAKNLAKAQEYGESTIVSPRDYIHDAAFLVALAVNPEYGQKHQGLLDLLKAALEAPKWPLYLGRKSCVPARPVLVSLTEEYRDLEDALRKEPWAAPVPVRKPGYPRETDCQPRLEAWVECQDGEYERQDAIRLNQLRFYDFRRCRRFEVDAAGLERRAV